MEIWKDIPDYEGLYQVSNLGNVKSLSRIILRHGKYPFLSKELILKAGIYKTGYRYVILQNKRNMKSFTIHCLVAKAFLNHKPDGTRKIVIDHINNIKWDNRLENLQLITHRQNTSKDKKNTSSKYTGVSFDKEKNKWKSCININKKLKHLGYFKNEYDAHLEYQKALSEL